MYFFGRKYLTFQKIENDVKPVIYKDGDNNTEIKDPLRNVKGTGVHFKFLFDKSGWVSPFDTFEGSHDNLCEPNCGFSGSLTSLCTFIVIVS